MDEREYLENKKRQISHAVAALYPMAAFEVRNLTEDERRKLGHTCADVIAEHSDRLLYPGRRPQPVREPSSLSAIATAMALLAYAPGGVTLWGYHYCNEPHPGCPGRQNGSAVKEA